MPARLIRIGSRRSALAVRQAELCRDALHEYLGDEARIELVSFQTSGDAYLAGSLSDIGNKGLFTKEIEQALLRAEIDIAVHSMKDMATHEHPELLIVAMPLRDDVRDVLLAPHTPDGGLGALPHGARIGTSSLRRAAQMLHYRPDLEITAYRGNLQRRLSKLEAGEVHATLLALSGMQRLALWPPYVQALPTDIMLPAVAQGALGWQCRVDDHDIRDLLQPLGDNETMACVETERHLLRLLDGSCRTPIAGLATITAGVMTLHGMLAAPDGAGLVRDSVQGAPQDGKALAVALAQTLRSQHHSALACT